VLVKGVGENGPAAKGGIQAGDVIAELNGKPVESVGQLRNQVARTAPGTEITLNVFRDGKTMDLKFPVGTQPDSIATGDVGGPSSVQTPAEQKDLGISVMPTTEEAAKKFHVAVGKGVVITELDPNGVAAQAQLTPGDVIMRVNGKSVDSPEAFEDAMSKAKLSDGVRLNVRSAGGMERLVFIQK
jgi:serine protease Do